MQDDLNFSPLTRQRMLAVKTSFVLLLLSAVGGVFFAYHDALSLEVELQGLAKEVDSATQKTIGPEIHVVKMDEFRRINEKIQSISPVYVSKPLAMNSILTALEESLPNDVYFSNLTVNRADGLIRAEGRARTPADFSKLILGLRGNGAFSKVEILRQYTPPAKSGGGVQFELQLGCLSQVVGQ